MDLGLRGKVALVTGGSGDIGLAVARRLAAEGAEVALTARRAAPLRAAARAIGEASGRPVLALAGDMTRPPDVRRVVERTLRRFGRLHVLVNSVGAAAAGPFAGLSKRDWEASFASKVLGQVLCAREVFPHLCRQRWGRIINLIGSHGRLAPTYAMPAGVTNAGLLNFTKALAKLGAPANVLVNGVNPGPVLGRRMDYVVKGRAAADRTSLAGARRLFEKQIPLGRFGTPEEIADLVVFLASERASFITGALVDADGGQTGVL
jgi:NAD(P)-dependent dehydrogenase (short-subunit alcohol dehydrogenase family)